MSKFEQVGVSRQYDAVSKEEANHRFSTSCTICCNRGMQISCDRCAIACAHAISIAAFDSVAVPPVRA